LDYVGNVVADFATSDHIGGKWISSNADDCSTMEKRLATVTIKWHL